MIYVLLAAYNEEKDLAPLLEDFARAHFSAPLRIVLVDDGSTDRTREIAVGFEQKIKLDVLFHAENLGMGRALDTGLKYISGMIAPGDTVVTMDADNTHKPYLINELVRKLDSGCEIAIASRFAGSGGTVGVPAFRRILSACAAFMLKFLFPIEGVNDYTSGYRAYSFAAVKGLFERYGGSVISEEGFTSQLELLLKARAAGAKCAEIPMELRYDAKTGKSKMKVFRTIFRYLVLSAKIKFSL